ncbi:hypothetical protein CEUSTIGMA_g11772.t1 [Chlamydomonas eustigma]|uniref:Nudix hydrolase domain-containing protein n=1 Tax=Chlamydomonas eustigma TaxID=1157962 RepID=A0A250XNG4_9CHLO|nr:hypothetical protein CEUSTIGMA_g11772.t1 [Chlamydomonas eustigma]|eukprot:GAX84350.1 hypothetical protein CEUSTIGMA_g11772.t1 [Chlamydomonas eustigma]
MLRSTPLTSLWTRKSVCNKLLATVVSPRSVKLSSFNGTTSHQLQSWLESNGVDTSGYGSGLAKTISELFEETGKRESILDLEGGRALRVVRVLSLYVINEKGQVLFEEEQVLPDGRSRFRNVALSEKLIGDEDWRHAVDRAVKEELGSILPSGYKITVLEDTYKLLTHQSNSMSYPNLTTKYIIHRVSANVTDIPQEPFSTHEPRPGGRLTTKWVWRCLSPDLQTNVLTTS